MRSLDLEKFGAMRSFEALGHFPPLPFPLSGFGPVVFNFFYSWTPFPLYFSVDPFKAI